MFSEQRVGYVGRSLLRWLSVCLMLALLSQGNAPASAAQAVAPALLSQDGQALSDQSPETQATFKAVWGDRASARWVEENDLALAGGQPVTGPRIAFFSSGSPLPTGPAPFVRGLRELGYRPGQNITIEWRFAAGQNELLPSTAAELVGRSMDVIVTYGAPEAIATQKLTSTIPIVMANGPSDPVGLGLVASFERPGANITGMAATDPGFYGRRLELLHEVVPDAARIGILNNPTNPAIAVPMSQTRDAAESLGLQLQSLEASNLDEVDAAFAAASAENAGALILLPDVLWGVPAYSARVLELAERYRLPVMHQGKGPVVAGALMEYFTLGGTGPRRAAGYVDKILKGAKPSDLPVGVPDEFELVLNLKTAQAFGLTIPQSVLDQATEIIAEV